MRRFKILRGVQQYKAESMTGAIRIFPEEPEEQADSGMYQKDWLTGTFGCNKADETLKVWSELTTAELNFENGV